ncbi:MAG TPA: hypothetical protein VH640_21615 [Bryobacteraceae bacterium]|jgi:hypothetical protein
MEAAFARARASDAQTVDGPAGAFWECFRRRLLTEVCDCNGVAGEPIWTISEQAETPHRLEIQSTKEPFGSLVLLFDTVQECLSCTFGTPQSDCWDFQILSDGLSARRAETVYGIDASVNAILDNLTAIAGAECG